jgi:hypothetical protein
VPTPWTQSLALSWRPALRFYEERIGILRDFDDAQVLRAFKVGENTIDAQLFGGECRISVSQSGATLQLLSPQADLKGGSDALAAVVAALSLSEIRSLTVGLQYVEPIELPFREAVDRGHEQVFGAKLGAELRLGDWAVLQDLHLGDHDERDGGVEFGIVQASEVPQRLARIQGRAQGEHLSPGVWSQATFPPVALFADSFWSLREHPMDGELMSSVAGFWETVREKTGSLVVELHSTLTAKGDAAAERKDSK